MDVSEGRGNAATWHSTIMYVTIVKTGVDGDVGRWGGPICIMGEINKSQI